ncbi:MAG: hypothetical protein AAB690_02550 [Patescibacteria group bacterium]
MDPSPEQISPGAEPSAGQEAKFGIVLKPDQQSKLSARLIETRAGVQAHVQKAMLLFDIHTSEAGVQQTPDQLRDSAITERRELENKRFSYQRNIELEIDERLGELDQARGLRRIPAVLEKNRLERQKAGILKQVGQLEAQIQVKQQVVDKISGQEMALLVEIGQEVQSIQDEYEQLVQEVFQDGTMTAEIREAYIQQVIIPKVDKIVVEQQLPKDKREAFETALRAYIDHRDEPEAQKRLLKQELDSHEDEFYGARDYYEPLLNGGDKKIVQQLVVRLADQDIAPIKAAVEPRLRGYDMQDKFSRIFEKTQHGRYPDMEFWQAVKASNSANQVFGEAIQMQDQGFYLMALDKSLSTTEGEDIDVLRYYPTPEAIRNLTVIASADYRNYRTVHANWSLTALSRRPDWKSILDRAEEVYPSLKSARPVLEAWNYKEYGNNPEIQQVSGNLALAIFEGDPTDQRLTSLATEALPNSLILDVLVKRGIVPASDATIFKEAGDFLRDLSKDLWEKIRQSNDRSILYVEGYYFHKTLREELFPLLRQQKSTRQSPIVMRRLGTLSQLILENKSNPQLLDNLTNNNLIDRIKDPSKKVEGAFLFLQEFQHTDQLLSAGHPIDVTRDNWQVLLMSYVRSHNEIAGLPQFSADSRDKINSLFEGPKIRNFCLNELSNLWRLYLKEGKEGEIPASLGLIPGFIEYCGGAGLLSQIESLSLLISRVEKAFSKGTTAERTKGEIFQGLRVMEGKFVRERWSNEDRTDFYNISRDILGAAPGIFSDSLSLFGKLTPSQIRQFNKEIYPLYRTKLVLMEKKDDKGNITYDRRQLLELRTGIRNFTDLMSNEGKPFEIQKQRLLEEIRGLFKDRFGIVKIPENFTSEHVRSFTNVSNYLANMHERTPDKEAALGFYLSLMINDQWDDFRRGEIIDPDEYLIPEKSSTIKNLLRERQRLNPLTPENLGISIEDVPEFLKLLQQESQNIVIGNVETIDVKLTNIILNLHGLEDPDLYPNLLDKQRMQLLLKWGNKKVGSVVARMYQKATSAERQTQFSEEDNQIQEKITEIIKGSELAFSPQVLKEHFQDGIKPLATVVNLLSFIGETGAETEIESLRRLLEPSKEIIRVFGRLGEDFKPTSGAMALSQDLSYLDTLVVKREDELKPEEKVLLTQYTANIRDQVIKLEAIYGQIKSKFGSLKQGVTISGSPLLQGKLAQIDRIINTQTTQQTITSTATNNLNTIIENIRECLSCTKDGCNNDTNLTFGDTNKFYLYSQTETQEKGSISDELVFLEPVTRADGSYGMAFVLDRIYGVNTPTVLESQVGAVLKKYRVIKQRFPDVKLTVFVSDVAVSTGGTSIEMFLERLNSKNVSVKKEVVEVNVAESSVGDHYIEFGGSARSAGKRQVNGIVLSI